MNTSLPKKAAVLFLAFIMLFSAASCSRTYELPWDQFCYDLNENSVVDLSIEDKEYIIDVLNGGEWIDGLADMTPDYAFGTRTRRVEYDFGSGTLNDVTSKQHLTVSEEQRGRINKMLGAVSGYMRVYSEPTPEREEPASYVTVMLTREQDR